ncbi:MAG: type IV pilus assembly protein PilM [Patescibacteria group bacterium]
MALFGKTVKQSYLGIDIGAGSIKVVELMNEKGRAKLLTYGFAEHPVAKVGESLLDKPEEAAALVKEICKRAKTSTVKVVSGLPVSSVFSSVVTVPVATGKALSAVVELQAKKLIPMPLEEMILETTPMPDVSGDAKKANYSRLLLTGAAKTLVKKYIDVFKMSGLQLLSLETEAFALIRSLIGRDRANVMIIDMGAMRTNIVVVQSGIPFLSRSLNLGGLALSRAMAETMRVPLSQAEQMKIDAQAVAEIMPDVGLPKMFDSALTMLLNEIRYSSNLYAGQNETPRQIEKIILTGGAALFPRLADAIGATIGIKTYVGDPWARVVYPLDLRPVLDQIGARFSVAVGLAMRDIE